MPAIRCLGRPQHNNRSQAHIQALRITRCTQIQEMNLEMLSLQVRLEDSTSSLLNSKEQTPNTFSSHTSGTKWKTPWMLTTRALVIFKMSNLHRIILRTTSKHSLRWQFLHNLISKTRFKILLNRWLNTNEIYNNASTKKLTIMSNSPLCLRLLSKRVK